MKRRLERDAKHVTRNIATEYVCVDASTGFNSVASRAHRLRKPYRTLMHSIRPEMCNGGEKRPEDLKRNRQELKAVGNRLMGSRSSVIEVAAQQSLRLDLTQRTWLRP